LRNVLAMFTPTAALLWLREPVNISSRNNTPRIQVRPSQLSLVEEQLTNLHITCSA